VSDSARVQLRILHQTVGGRHELLDASLDRVGRLDERVESLGDHLDGRQRVAVVSLAHVQQPLKLVQFILQLQQTTSPCATDDWARLWQLQIAIPKCFGFRIINPQWNLAHTINKLYYIEDNVLPFSDHIRDLGINLP